MTTQRVEKRRMLLFLLLPVLLFAALVFYALGGGHPAAAANTLATKGINTTLPDAAFKKAAPADKMTIYDQAKKDSSHAQGNGIKAVADKLGFNPAPDPQARQISEKLAAINKVISTPVTTPAAYGPSPATPGLANDPASKDVARLETLLKNMQQTSGGSDPQMAQLNTLMDKILDVQHPERAAAKMQQTAGVKPDSLFKAIPASIEGSQKVLQGGIVKLRLNDTLRVKGWLLPKGQLLFGNASITNQRLLLDIKDVRIGSAIIPVDFTVYSLDGLPGINAPDAELAGAAGNGADNALQSMQFLSMDENLGAQAATGGIEAAKTLFSKKIGRIKVKLKSGYPLLLRDNTKKTR
jgi:hypothetical protein